jgi:hypothetical protein
MLARHIRPRVAPRANSVVDVSTTRSDVRQFDFRYDRWCGWFMGLLGMGGSRSRVVADDDAVEIVMGWSFRARVPRSSIMTVERPDWQRRPWLGWGVHGWRGRWLVNGSLHGLVSIEIDPPAPSRVIGFRGKLRQVVVSLEEPEAFVGEITAI